MSYHEISLTNVSDSWMPADASKIDEAVVPMKSDETTWSEVRRGGD